MSKLGKSMADETAQAMQSRLEEAARDHAAARLKSTGMFVLRP